jgi:hypothetical protein
VFGRQLGLLQAAVWKPEGYSNADMVARQECYEPTAERRFVAIRRMLRKL